MLKPPYAKQPLLCILCILFKAQRLQTVIFNSFQYTVHLLWF